MLQLILGVAGTGKTTRVFQQLQARAAEGRASLLLVPEQFSAAAEGLVLQRLGDAASALVEVASFRTLAERILREAGGLLLPVLDEADRAVYVRRALEAVGSQLTAFARQRRSAAFCNLCAHTLAELKTAGAGPDTVQAIAQAEKDDKLMEIALVYRAYEAAIAGHAADPEDRLALAARLEAGYINGRAVYVDGFDGFTAPEYGLLEGLMQKAEGLCVTLCCPNLDGTGAPGLFTPVRRAGRRLKNLAEAAGQKSETVLLGSLAKRPQAAGLCAVNSLLAFDEAPGQDDTILPAGGVYLNEYDNEWAELRAVAAEMRRLALGGVPYSKMALVCRDVAAYEPVVRRQLGLYGVPFFADFAGTIEYTAPVAFLRAGLGLLRGGLNSDSLLALAKTGLCGYDVAELAALENYVFTWAPKAADWRAPFTGNPEGLLAELDSHAAAQLAAAEGLRARLVPLADGFLQKARGASAKKLSKSLYLLLDRAGAPAHLEALAAGLEARGELPFAQQLRRAWDLAMQMLDKMAALLGDEVVDAAEYDELLLILVRSTDFAQAPQTLECVLFSGADRMRLAEPDYCFVVGLCEGEFPMQVGYSGLLSHSDRDLLVAGGVEMPGSFENRTLLEEMFFYRALCAPRRGLYLSWPKRRAAVAKAPAAALQPVVEALAPPELELESLELAATPAAAYDLLCTEYRDNTPLAATLYSALGAAEGPGGEDWHRALGLLAAVDNPGTFQLAAPRQLEGLVGRDMTLSATVAQQYFNCKFSYYMERVLRVKPRKKAELSPLESGTFVHFILEKVLAEAGAGFAQCTDEWLAEAAARHADAFIAAGLPTDTRRATWQLGQIKETVVRLLCYMRTAASHSEFEIDAVELAIGDGPGAVAPLTIHCADGRTVRVSGQVDRVDVLRRDGHSYLCIVDYKTGDKKLDLKELYNGLNMQMMIYMDALCRDEGRYPGAVPAGVLYLGSDPAPATGQRGEGESQGFATTGLLLRDPAILRAMDDEGAILPVRYKADGSPRASQSLADPAKWKAISAHVRGLLGQMAEGVHAGQFPARPVVAGGRSPCAFCAYRPACRHEDGQNETPATAPPGVFESPDEGGGADG